MNIDENHNRDNLLMQIVVYINEKLSYDFQQSVDNVIMLICDQIEQYHAIIGDVEYLDYIKENLPHHKDLSIFGSGNPILDNNRVGNLFMEIDRLKAEFNNSAHKEQNNSTQGSFIFHHFIKNAEKVIKERGVDYLLREVKYWLNDITNDLRQVSSDYKHLERWFALMEDHATTNTQRYDLGQLKEHFEQLKQQPTPQDETTSSQLLAAQDEGAGDEVETGNLYWEKMDSFNSKIGINIACLYSFLKKEKVIQNINITYLSNCIYHARLDLLLQLPKKKKNKLKYTFHILKEYMEEDWITKVCELSGLSQSKLSGATLTDKVKFGNKLKELIKKPQ